MLVLLYNLSATYFTLDQLPSSLQQDSELWLLAITSTFRHLVPAGFYFEPTCLLESPGHLFQYHSFLLF